MIKQIDFGAYFKLPIMYMILNHTHTHTHTLSLGPALHQAL